jgi:hypothetical protein
VQAIEFPRRRCGFGVEDRNRRRCGDLARPLAPQVPSLGGEQAEEPRQHPLPLVESPTGLDRGKERALQEILGIAAVAGEPHRHVQQLASGAIEDLAERGRFTGAAEVHEALVEGGTASHGDVPPLRGGLLLQRGQNSRQLPA